jgi:hypothetical protein
MMTLPMIKAPKRTIEPTRKLRRRTRDEFFADPRAIESDYYRMARRLEESSHVRRA